MTHRGRSVSADAGLILFALAMIGIVSVAGTALADATAPRVTIECGSLNGVGVVRVESPAKPRDVVVRCGE